jgi:hypothetical protein
MNLYNNRQAMHITNTICKDNKEQAVVVFACTKPTDGLKVLNKAGITNVSVNILGPLAGDNIQKFARRSYERAVSGDLNGSTMISEKEEEHVNAITNVNSTIQQWLRTHPEANQLKPGYEYVDENVGIILTNLNSHRFQSSEVPQSSEASESKLPMED